MRTQNGFSFALALTLAACFFLMVPASAQTIHASNGYQFDTVVTGFPFTQYVPADGFAGFCPQESAPSFAQDALVPIDGSHAAYLLADQRNSYNSYHGGPNTFFTSIDNGVAMGGHACGLHDFLVLVYNDQTPGATLMDLVYGKQPVLANFFPLVVPGQLFNWLGGSGIPITVDTVAANYGRVIFVGRLQVNGAIHNLAIAIFNGAPPQLLGDLGTEGQAIQTVVTAGTVYVKMLSADRTSQRIMAVTGNKAPFQIAQQNLTGYIGDLSNQELLVAVNRNTAVVGIRENRHLVLQKLADGNTSPLTFFDSPEVNGNPVDRLLSLALTDDGRVTYVMQSTIFRSDLNGNTSTVMMDGVDIPHRLFSSWEVASNGNLTIAGNRGITYQVLDPAGSAPSPIASSTDHQRGHATNRSVEPRQSQNLQVTLETALANGALQTIKPPQ